ncbi:hypothetical protein E2C01_102317 [Portunus trituberculatus]|uniref:Uncharacterized protein n=1 Tax=Portunus trituberculatus TaxID=210409 RepID=A0A5B7KCV1_PORTR|nr:hypothetical protein [Portunus trituberculatus]
MAERSVEQSWHGGTKCMDQNSDGGTDGDVSDSVLTQQTEMWLVTCGTDWWNRHEGGTFHK